MCVCVCAFQFSRVEAQLVLIAQNTVSITSSSITLKATCSPTVLIRTSIYIWTLLYCYS